jgi:CP family cyanate transporter-like MFS transporter
MHRSEPRRRVPWTPALLLSLAAVLLLTLSLRTAMASVAPIAAFIDRDIGLDGARLGLLGMAPAVAFAAAGLFSAAFSRRVGLEMALLLSVVVMSAAHLMRALAPNFGGFLTATLVILLAAGIGGILLPPYIKMLFDQRAAAVAAAYVCVISLGTALPPIVAVPVAEAAGWRASLNVWTLIAASAALPWAVAWFISRRRTAITVGGAPPAAVPNDRAVLRSRTFWALTLVHGLNTFFTFTVFAWLPAILVSVAGLPAGQSGWLLGLFALITIPLAYVLPWIVGRVQSHGHGYLVHFFGVCLTVGWGGLLFFPHPMPVLWVTLMSLGAGLFIVYQLLLIRRTRVSETTARVSGYSQTLGYVFGATGPLLVGMLHTWTGGWTAPMIVVLACCSLVFLAGHLIRRSGMIDAPFAGPAPDSAATGLPDATSSASDSYDPNLDKIGKP